MTLQSAHQTHAVRGVTIGLALTAFMWAGACTDGTGPEPVRIPSTAFVSNPVARVPTGSSEVPPTAGTTAYVSLTPGTLRGGEVAAIRNAHNGGTVIATMMDGGFDPVPVAAAAGDTLELEIRLDGGDTHLQFTTVPATAKPRVVRTSPSHQQRHVAPTTVPRVVFSEPIDPATLTEMSVQLRTGTRHVPGRLELQDPAQLVAAFIPETSLAEATDYRLAVTDEIRDLDGDPLAAPVTPQFTTAGAAPAGQVAFSSPGGFGSERIIHAMNPDGTGRRTLRTLAADGYPSSWDPYPWGRLAWSPDGAQIALQTGRGALFVMNADGSDIWMLGGQPGSTDILNDAAAWSPDGAKIAFASFTWYWADQGTGIYVADTLAFTGGAVRPANRLTTGYDWWPAWSPDGKQIAFARFEATYFLNPGLTSASDIFVMKADGSAVKRLTNQRWRLYGLSWSPDGGKIAFSADMGSCQPTFVMNTDGSGITRLTSCPGADRNPSWSPDGAKIVFERDEDIYTMNVDGSDVTRLTWEGAVHPAWSPKP